MAAPSHQAALAHLSITPDAKESISSIRDYLNQYSPTQGPGSPSATMSVSLPAVVLTELEKWRPMMKDLVDEVEKAKTSRCSCSSLQAQAPSNEELLRDVSKILNGIGSIHWVLAGASLLGLVLGRIVEVKDTDDECRDLFMDLRSFSNDLCEFEMQRRVDDSSQSENVERATNLIVCGATICYKHMDRKRSSRIPRILVCSSTKRDLQQLRTYLNDMYKRLEFAKILEIASRTPGPFFQETINYPTTVGVDERKEAVLKLVDFGGHSAFAVSLVGMGGIGKTTLGDTVYCKLVEMGSVQKMSSVQKMNSVQKMIHCKVELELEEEKNNIEKLQTEIFEKLSGTSIPNKISNSTNGQYLLKELLQKIKKEGHWVVLIYMDNIPSRQILSKILPQENCLPNGSRILLTTRLKSVCSELKDSGLIKDCLLFEVKEVGKEPAMKFLCENSKGRNGREPSRQSLEAVAEACNGLPLALKVAAGYIKEQDRDPDEACRIVAANMQSGDEEELFKSLGFMIEALDPMQSARPSKARIAFNDIVTFDNLRGGSLLLWEEVGMVVGGEDALEVLEQRSLVRREVMEEERGHSGVWVHDQLLAAGRRLCKVKPDDKQIMHWPCPFSLQKELQGKDCTQVEWLSLRHGSIHAEELNSLCNLRMLDLQFTEFQGRVKLSQTLRCLFFRCDDVDQSTNVLNSILGATGLRVLSMKLPCTRALHDLQLPNGLKSVSIHFDGSGSLPPAFGSLQDSLEMLDLTRADISSLVKDLGGFNRLKRLLFSECHSSEELPNQLTNLKSLRHLTMTSANFTSLPEELGQISTLEVLNLSGCVFLKHLPESVEGLKSLTRLDLSGCANIVTLPKDLGHLASLKRLCLDDCRSLINLPDRFSGLISLKYLSLKDCERLEVLPSDLGQLFALEELDASRCGDLISLPDSMGTLTLLRVLRLADCDNLRNLPEGLGQLASLQTLELDGCKRLRGLPKDMSRLTSLKMLALRDCERLSIVSTNIGRLSAIQELEIIGCRGFDGFSDSLEGFKSLKTLIIEECWNFIALPPSFGKLTALEMLCLKGCEKLSSLPNDVSGLTSLRRLLLEDCRHLTVLSLNFGQQQAALEELEVKSCRSLDGFPDSLEGLASLRRLVIEKCENIITLPPGFGKLSSLNELEVKSCRSLNGFPDSLEGLASLRRLIIETCENVITLPPGFGKLSSLEELEVKSCRSFDGFPDSLEGLASLRRLVIEKCENIISLPPGFRKLPSLEVLLLKECNRFSGLPNDVSGWKSLKKLLLEDCEQFSVNSSNFGQQQSALKELEVKRCRGLRGFPDSHEGLVSLWRLVIEECENLITLPLKLPKLRELYLSGCKRLTGLPADVSGLMKLTVKNCESLRGIPSELGQMSNLIELEVGRCTSFDELPDGLKSLNRLAIVEWENWTSIPRSFAESASSSLRMLELKGCKRLRSLPSNGLRLESLWALWVRDCKSLRELPNDWGQLTGLVSLVLSGCKNLATLPESLGQLTGLWDLNLNGCKNLVRLPEEGLGQLTGVSSLHLSGCKSLVTLPETLGQLTGLSELNLSGCQELTTLPEALGRLTGLERLNLSGCKKLIALPEALGRLTNLSVLNLSWCQELLSLPETLGHLKLSCLNLEGCSRLAELPESWPIWRSLEGLSLADCDSLRTLPPPNYSEKEEYLVNSFEYLPWLQEYEEGDEMEDYPSWSGVFVESYEAAHEGQGCHDKTAFGFSYRYSYTHF